MKIAIISVTENAKNLGLEIQEKLSKDPTVIKCDCFYKNVKENFNYAFNNYDGIIAIMASGITVRTVAPLIKSKDKDPAILNIDEKGEYVVSLLSGHLGGGNDLTRKIARLIRAKPVISTSTDVNYKYGVDTIASRYYYRINNVKSILPFNKAVLNNIPFTIKSEKDINFLKKYFLGCKFEQLPEKGYSDNDLENKVNLGQIQFSFESDGQEFTLEMDERKLVVGIGSRRGKTMQNVMIAVENALENLNIPISRVNSFATISIKKDEEGIINACKHYNRPLEIIDIDDVRIFTSDDCSRSEFVQKKFGIDGVCEQCAMIAVGEGGKLIHKKIAMDGVTVAVAVSK